MVELKTFFSDIYGAISNQYYHNILTLVQIDFKIYQYVEIKSYDYQMYFHIHLSILIVS